jgi:hypothetical protein
VADIRKQIGLDFLQTRNVGPGPSSNRVTDRASAGFSGALIAYGKDMLAAVRLAEPAPARLHDVLERLNMPIDIALEVVKYLEDQGFVTVVDRDLKGNHALRTTAAGAALLR